MSRTRRRVARGTAGTWVAEVSGFNWGSAGVSGLFEKGWVAMIFVTMKEAVEIAKAMLRKPDSNADWLDTINSVSKFRALFVAVIDKKRDGEDLCFLFDSDDDAAVAGQLFQPLCKWDENEFMDITGVLTNRTDLGKVFLNARGAVESWTAGTVFWTRLSELVGEILSQFPKDMHSDLLMQMQDACSVYGSDYDKFLKERWQS